MIMQGERAEDVLLARSRQLAEIAERASRREWLRRSFTAAAKAERDGMGGPLRAKLEQDAMGGPLSRLEVTLVRETADGFVACADDVIPLLARIGDACAGRDERARELQHLQRDCIVALWRAGVWKVPPGGIQIACEACGEQAALTPQRRSLTLVVPWSRGCLDDPGDARRGSRRFDYESPDGVRVVRHVLVGACCSRRRVVRCRHEWWVDSNFARWTPCARLAVGADYCPLHRSRQARDERGRYDWAAMPDAGARRVPDWLATA
jgi:hypothetical protein